MEGYKETEIGKIPESWELINFDALIELKRGKDLPKDKFISGEYPVAGSNGIIGYHNEYNYNGNGVTVGRSGTVGKVNFYLVNYWAHNTVLAVCDFKGNDEVFIFYYLNYLDLKRFSSGVSVPTLNRNTFRQIIVVKPSKIEQIGIGKVLSVVQTLIFKQIEIMQNLQNLKKALMKKLFTEGLNGEPMKDTEIGKVPKSWEVTEIKKYINKTYQRNTNLLPDKEIQYIDVSSISNSTFTIEYATKYLGKDAPGRARKVVSEGDVIFATVRPTLKRIAIVNYEYENEYCSTAFCVLRTVNDMLNNEYLYYYLQTEYFISEIGKLQAGASYPAVRDIDVKNMKIPLPVLDEQINIANVFKGIDEKIKTVSQRHKTLNSLFNTLMNQLMTGKIRVKDLEI